MNAPSSNFAVYLADQNPSRDRSRGISRFTGALVSGLGSLGVYPTLLCSRSSYTPVTVQKNKVIILPWKTENQFLRIASDLSHRLISSLPSETRWIYPKGYIPPLGIKSNSIVIIHDAISWYYKYRYPGCHPYFAQEYFIHNLNRSLKFAETVCTVSDFSRRQLEEFAEFYRITIPKIHVIGESLDYVPDIPIRSVANRDGVLMMSSSAPHKGVVSALVMWEKLQSLYAMPRLDLVGSMSGSIAECAMKIKDISHHAFVDDKKLFELMSSSRALLFPSEIEGFGLPVLEAALLGTPSCYIEGSCVGELLPLSLRAGCYQKDDPESLFVALERAQSIGVNKLKCAAQEMRTRYNSQTLSSLFMNACSS